MIDIIVNQQCENTITLAQQRLAQLSAPNVALRHLERIDNRIEAHLDGLRIAGKSGLELCFSKLDDADAGEVFLCMVLSLESMDFKRMTQVMALSQALPETQSGIEAAVNWVESEGLVPVFTKLLSAGNPFFQSIGLAALSLHRIDAGTFLENAMGSGHVPLQVKAMEAASVLGRLDLLAACEASARHDDSDIGFQASWSATLLGSRNCLGQLGQFAIESGTNQQRALNLLLKAVPLPAAHKFIQALSKKPANQRSVIRAVGICGDTFYIPWLIERMGEPEFTRLAGESFSFITGLDLAYLDLDRKPPEDFEGGPNDDPEDTDVDLDEDDDLPWPDAEKVTHWWWQHGNEFNAGERYFMGKPITREHCLHVIKEGYQRQRIAAAEYLCLLNPGSVLFPVSAPAWRQRKLLADWLSAARRNA